MLSAIVFYSIHNPLNVIRNASEEAAIYGRDYWVLFPVARDPVKTDRRIVVARVSIEGPALVNVTNASKLIGGVCTD